jgi:prevent-host-death family protein
MSRSSISIRELRRSIKRVLDRVERGETIELTHRGQPVAEIGPCSVDRGPAPWPNLEDRTRAVFGDRLISPSASAAVSDGRGEHVRSPAPMAEHDQTSDCARATLLSRLRAEPVTNIGRRTRAELYDDDL